MELCQMSVKDLQAMNAFIPMKDIKHIARGLNEALIYIHGLNIIHRDLKPANVLLNSQNEVKLCDFGLAIFYDKNHLNLGQCCR